MGAIRRSQPRGKWLASAVRKGGGAQQEAECPHKDAVTTCSRIAGVGRRELTEAQWVQFACALVWFRRWHRLSHSKEFL